LLCYYSRNLLSTLYQIQEERKKNTVPSSITVIATPVMENIESAVYLVRAVAEAFYIKTEDLP